MDDKNNQQAVSIISQKTADDSSTDQSNKADQKETLSIKSDIDIPPNAVSGPGKEFANVTGKPAVSADNVEYISPSVPEPVIPPEVAVSGVEAVKNTEQITISPILHQAAGIKPEKTAVPFPNPEEVKINIPHLPMDEQQALTVDKTHPPADSVRWLSKLTRFVIECFKYPGTQKK